ncbi:MAG: hypothetical protein WCD81_10385 [Candidatus Bathyarchaeia archaeon]
MSERSHVGLTMREKQLVDVLLQAIKDKHTSPLRYAASQTHMEYVSARNMLFRLRNRYDRARRFVEDYGKLRSQLKSRRYL